MTVTLASIGILFWVLAVPEPADTVNAVVLLPSRKTMRVLRGFLALFFPAFAADEPALATHRLSHRNDHP